MSWQFNMGSFLMKLGWKKCYSLFFVSLFHSVWPAAVGKELKAKTTTTDSQYIYKDKLGEVFSFAFQISAEWGCEWEGWIK